jgi:hypothetical protein
MSTYEIVIACVAVTNLTLTILSLLSGRAKAASSKLTALETSLREDITRLTTELQSLKLSATAAVNHDHLAEVYRDLKGIAEQVHTLVGQQAQMNELMRQLLAKQLRA